MQFHFMLKTRYTRWWAGFYIQQVGSVWTMLLTPFNSAVHQELLGPVHSEVHIFVAQLIFTF